VLPLVTGMLGQINALAPVSAEAIALQQYAVILTLAQSASIIQATSFTDRESVELLLTQINDEFGPAIENAADNCATEVYLALIGLHAAITLYLVQTEQPLPYIVEYAVGATLPSLVLAMRLYADPDDVDMLASQLVSENLVVNAAFMPRSGIALSSG